MKKGENVGNMLSFTEKEHGKELCQIKRWSRMAKE